VLQDLRHHSGLGTSLIPAVKYPVMDVDISTVIDECYGHR
jgi:hypothetical protein